MSPYPEYKPTGLPWLPQIPKGWETIKVRELFTERNQKVSDKDYAPLSVSKGGIVPQIATVAKTDNGDNRKLVKVGDFVINSRSDRKGSSGVSAYNGSVSLINLDYERVPFQYAGGIDAFFANEVKPFVPDAWIDESKTQIGYELSFTKYFYKPVQLRSLEEITADLRQLEAETAGLLNEILGGAK